MASERRTPTVSYAPKKFSHRSWWVPVLLYQRHLISAAWYGTLGAGVVASLALGYAISTGNRFGLAVASAAFVINVINGRRLLVPKNDLTPARLVPADRAPIAFVAAGDPNIIQCPSTGDHIETSAEVDEWLSTGSPPKIRFGRPNPDRSKEQIAELRRESDLNRRILWAEARRARARKIRFANEAKICLWSDLTEGTATAEVSRSSYFTSFLLNERCRRKFVRTYDERAVAIDEPGDYFTRNVTDGKGHLLANSRLRTSPHIGANLIAIGSDGQMVLWQQANAAHSEGHLVPSGSGSLDWSDLGGGLLDAVIAGATREFLEESHQKGALLAPSIAKMQIIGYFRWVDRACLPGFVLLAKLGTPSFELRPNVSEVQALPSHVDLAASTPDDLALTIATLLDAGNDTLPPVSTSLFAALTSLKRWLERNAHSPTAAAFFGSEAPR